MISPAETTEANEYFNAQQLRIKYPKVLTPEQQDELVSLLPTHPNQEAIVCMGIVSQTNPAEVTEIDLYWKYQAKLAGVKAKDAVTAYRQNPHPALAHAQGGLLQIIASKALDDSYAPVDISRQAKEDYARMIVKSWMDETPEDILELQKLGYREFVGIHLNTVTGMKARHPTVPQAWLDLNVPKAHADTKVMLEAIGDTVPNINSPDL